MSVVSYKESGFVHESKRGLFRHSRSNGQGSGRFVAGAIKGMFQKVRSNHTTVFHGEFIFAAVERGGLGKLYFSTR